MARYIDADKIEYTARYVGMDEFAGFRTLAYKEEIDAIPTADVAPKSEVDDLQDALKCEKETNKHLNDEYIDLMKENEKLTINMNAYGLTAKRLAEEKTEVAREILDEAIRTVYSKIDMKIYNTIEGKPLGDGVAFGKQQAMYDVITLLAELKKEYTEERE